MKAVLEDWRTAPVNEKIRGVLEFLTKFVPPEMNFGKEDIDKLKKRGLSDRAIRDVLYASFCFQNMSRFADVFDWPLPNEEQRRFAGKFLYKMGYKRSSLPPPF